MACRFLLDLAEGGFAQGHCLALVHAIGYAAQNGLIINRFLAELFVATVPQLERGHIRLCRTHHLRLLSGGSEITFHDVLLVLFVLLFSDAEYVVLLFLRLIEQLLAASFDKMRISKCSIGL